MIDEVDNDTLGAEPLIHRNKQKLKIKEHNKYLYALMCTSLHTLMPLI